jgi:hypothetical protein
MNICKYAFNSKQQFNAKFKSLHTEDKEGVLIPDFKFAIVELGNIILAEATFDEEGKELTEIVISERYHVDAMWHGQEDHPYGWKSYNQDLDTEGIHGFAGINYLEHKF